MKRLILIIAIVSGLMFMTTSCGNKSNSTSKITLGDKSKFDTLSYALGANAAYSMKLQFADIPIDYDKVADGIEDTTIKTSSMTAEDAIVLLQDYYTRRRPGRLVAIKNKRDAADSLAIANGADPKEVADNRASMPADEAMFVSEAEKDSISYAFGVNLGADIKKLNIPVQIYWYQKAISDIVEESDEPMMEPKAASSYIQNYFTVVIPANNARESQAWLAEIENQDGVQKTESGLLYKIEIAGDTSVVATSDRDVVKVKYTGKTRDGSIFDTSRFEDMSEEDKASMKKHEPENYGNDRIVEFSLGGVIKGWTEGMKLVGKGGRISLWIPAEMAYKESGVGRVIGPNEALYFDVELLDVIPTDN